MSKARKICHEKRVGIEKNIKGRKFTVTLVFTKEQFGWIQAAADAYSDGCVCDIVGNCFWSEFERLTKQIASGAEQETH